MSEGGWKLLSKKEQDIVLAWTQTDGKEASEWIKPSNLDERIAELKEQGVTNIHHA